MNFLNDAFAQLRELFLSMTPGARITAGLLLAAVVVSLGYLFQQGQAGPDAFLFGGEHLPASQLDSMEAAIAKAGLGGHTREGHRIRVPAGQKSAYLAAIADDGALPPNFHHILESALDKGGPWESREATRQRIKVAKQQTLSEIIRAMDWVDDAMVLYDEQESRGLRRQNQVTGTVSVRPVVGEVLDPQRVKKLRELVAYSVVGLQPTDVVVANLGGESAYGRDGQFFAAAFEDEYYQVRVMYEQYKRESILNKLSYIPGVQVEVNAELDDVAKETTRDVKPDKEGTALRELSTTETKDQTTADGGGQIGLVAQGPSRQGVDEELVRTNKNSSSSEVIETENFVGAVEKMVVKQGYKPKEVWASISIPRNYLVEVWHSQNPTPDGEEPVEPSATDLEAIETKVVTTVENLVDHLLPRLTLGEDTYRQVKVAIVDTVAPPPIPPASLADTALAWTGRYWNSLAMLGIATLSLVMLRSMVKSAPTSVSPGGAPALSLEAEGQSDEEDDDQQADERPKLRITKGPTLKDDLVEMVREDPDAAATILRNWIGKAA